MAAKCIQQATFWSMIIFFKPEAGQQNETFSLAAQKKDSHFVFKYNSKMPDARGLNIS